MVQDPDQAWRRVQGRGKLRPGQLATLVGLAAWREREARRRNIPTSWLVRDATLVELARRRPATAAEAEGVRGLQLKRGRQMDELLEVIRSGAGEEPDRVPEIPAELRNRVKVGAAAGQRGAAGALRGRRHRLRAGGHPGRPRGHHPPCRRQR